MAYEEFRQKIIHLQTDVNLFESKFLDREEFKKFADNLRSNIDGWSRLCITGYFSETIRKQLEGIAKGSPITSVKLICPNLNARSNRDMKNLQALRKLSRAGVEIKINDRIHARFLVSYNPVEQHPSVKYWGLLLIGSFDFNKDCIGLERYDAGIKTKNPDLVKSAVELFEQIWNDSDSMPLKDYKP